MNKFEWINDQARIGYCWNYVDEKDVHHGYVMNIGNEWAACADFSQPSIKYSTMEEAKAVVEALIAMDN